MGKLTPIQREIKRETMENYVASASWSETFAAGITDNPTRRQFFEKRARDHMEIALKIERELSA